MTGLWNLSGSSGKTRTCDKVVNSHLLYQLSYRGIVLEAGSIVYKSDFVNTLATKKSKSFSCEVQPFSLTEKSL